jgi:hypothetical protein
VVDAAQLAVEPHVYVDHGDALCVCVCVCEGVWEGVYVCVCVCVRVCMRGGEGVCR